MAIVNRAVARMVDDVSGLTAVVSVDYDDAALRITAIRVDNPTSRAILAIARRVNNGRVYSSTFPAGQNTFISVPNSPPQDRLGVTVDAQGRVDGVEYELSWVVT